MKALTLHAPCPRGVCYLGKPVENRVWMGKNKDVLATSEGVPVGHYGQWGGPVVGMPGGVGK